MTCGVGRSRPSETRSRLISGRPSDKWPSLRIERDPQNHVAVRGGMDGQRFARRAAWLERIRSLWMRPALTTTATPTGVNDLPNMHAKE
jgi:hypothetical protein